MGCEKCNISKNPTYKKCMNCWKKNDSESMLQSVLDGYNMDTVEANAIVDRIISVDVARTGNNNHLMYTYNYTFTAGSTTNAWDNWDEDDWYITTTGYTR